MSGSVHMMQFKHRHVGPKSQHTLDINITEHSPPSLTAVHTYGTYFHFPNSAKEASCRTKEKLERKKRGKKGVRHSQRGYFCCRALSNLEMPRKLQKCLWKDLT